MGHFDGYPFFWDWPYATLSVREWYRHHPEIELYFSYVEDRTDCSPESVIDAPDGAPLERTHPALKEGCTRFRTSGIAVRDYLEHSERIQPMDGPGADEGRRNARRDALLGLFERVPLPVLDIFVPRYDEESKLARSTFVPTSWQLLVLGRGKGGVRDWPVLRAETDPRFGEPFEPAWLMSAMRVHAIDEHRLRDIFSLNHIGDAEIEERGGGSAKPRPGPPPDDDDGAEALRQRDVLDESEETWRESPGEGRAQLEEGFE